MCFALFSGRLCFFSYQMVVANLLPDGRGELARGPLRLSLLKYLV